MPATRGDGPIITEAESEEQYEPSISDGIPEEVVELNLETECEVEEIELAADDSQLPETAGEDEETPRPLRK